MRLDKFLAKKRPDVSRSRIQRAIKDGLVFVRGQKITDNDFEVAENQSEDVIVPEFESEKLQASNLELSIIFENEDLSVIDKPAGMVVHPGAGNKRNTLANILISKYPDIKNVGEPHRPGIVHRLDEDTSGLIVVAKTQKGYEYLKNTFLQHNIEKEYLALVQGVPPKKHGVIDVPLEKIPLKKKMRAGSGKEAITEYYVVSSDPLDQYALLRVKLHTGRTHQIRAHLSHIGYPIVGDTVYGKSAGLLDRQFLHAFRLKFQLMDGTWLELESKLPDDLRSTLTKLNIDYANHKF